MTETATQTPIDRLAGSWQLLLAQSAQGSPFLLPQWQSAWWRVWGEGAEAALLTVEEEGSLIGLAPLALRPGVCSLVGSSDLCDYLDFIAVRGREGPFLAALLPQLQALPWKTLQLEPVREDSLVLARFVPLARAQGWEVEVTPDTVSPWVELPTTWEGYLEGLNKKDRHELRRKLRRLLEADDIRAYAVSDVRGTGARLDEFLALMGESRPDKAEFMTPARAQFFREVVQALAEAGLARLWFLEHKGRPVATALCFDFQGTRYLYNSGFDRAYSHLSVGLALKALTIRDAIEGGLRRYDFLRGNEPYKYDLGGRDHPIYRCTVRR